MEAKSRVVPGRRQRAARGTGSVTVQKIKFGVPQILVVVCFALIFVLSIISGMEAMADSRGICC
ncbi:hypothetical protein HK26_12210 [Acetobacter okinawensis]|uniref:Uncharacterized protein n=1 Tax=Acetobacter okinawensis TaxID=1076594 RepID=A0A252BVD8_9PROT|nr:hypothetical protein HK26_12210 [Acetobacter okinawensis]